MVSVNTLVGAVMRPDAPDCMVAILELARSEALQDANVAPGWAIERCVKPAAARRR
jgi:hypothetical protein